MNNNRKRKIAIIGLDGATLDLIEPWAKDGFLPNLKKILDNGAYGRLKSVIPPHSAPAWSTLYTGKNLAKHGLYDFIDLRPNSYDIVPTSFADNKAQTFWEIIGSFGKKSTILNTPLTYPPKRINGIFASGLQTPPQAKDFTYPQGLRKEMDELADGYAIYPIEFNGDRDAYLKSLYEVTDKKFKVFLHYFEKRDSDLFMCVIQGTDLIQHYFWQFMDEAHPSYRENKKYKNAIRQYYQSIDTYLGQFMGQLDGQTTLIVLSDHGFSALHKHFYINNWLYRWGMIKFKQNPKAWFKKMCFALDFSPVDIYNFLFANKGAQASKKKVRHFFSFRDIDWPKTQAFSFTNSGQIFINLKGRQPQGCVEPGKEYEKVCGKIINLLSKIKDPQTGEQVIEKAYKRSQIYSGKYSAFIPDIFYLSNKGRYINRGGNKFYSNKLIEKCPPQEIGGSHTLYGIALFYGNGISNKKGLEGLEIQDIAPIVLAILGVDIPKDMDGKVTQEIFQQGFLKDLKYSPIKTDTDRGRHDYSQAEKEAIERRLKELGYID